MHFFLVAEPLWGNSATCNQSISCLLLSQIGALIVTMGNNSYLSQTASVEKNSVQQRNFRLHAKMVHFDVTKSEASKLYSSKLCRPNDSAMTIMKYTWHKYLEMIDTASTSCESLFVFFWFYRKWWTWISYHWTLLHSAIDHWMSRHSHFDNRGTITNTKKFKAQIFSEASGINSCMMNAYKWA